MDPSITAESTKVHLATREGEDNPLDKYFSGKFESNLHFLALMAENSLAIRLQRANFV